jgi:pimeloyl-ACP methyl ester carboxylesterase
MSVRVILCSALLLLAQSLTASDLVLEQQIARQVEVGRPVGTLFRLQSGEVDFLAIHIPVRNAQPRGGVILLHDRGMNPDWPDVVRPLRTRLPDHGWDTLAIQLPLASPGVPGWADPGLIAEALPRISAGVDFLRQRGAANIVLLGHGLGARMAIEYLRAADNGGVRALVAVGLAANGDAGDDGGLAALRTSGFPLLDIYGSRDSDSVLASARARAGAARAAPDRSYRTDEVSGADHFFTGLDELLVARVRSWLARYAHE